jgi:hypothetical protein
MHLVASLSDRRVGGISGDEPDFMVKSDALYCGANGGCSGERLLHAPGLSPITSIGAAEAKAFLCLFLVPRAIVVWRSLIVCK